MPEPIDAYRTLQVDPEADLEVIKAAYRRLARMYHPDLAPDTEAAQRMAAINAAFELVGDPGSRRRYDRDRTVARGGDSSAPAASPPSSAATPVETPRAPADTPPPRPPSPPEQVSRDWTSGRSSVGGGYDPSMRAPDGLGAAGPPPGRPSGSVLNFGRYAGWSLGEIARTDLEFVEWLDRTPIGRPYRDEIDLILRRAGRRASEHDEPSERRGLFRRR